MSFERIYKKFYSVIIQMAKSSRIFCNFIDEEDLAQEMFIHLWKEYKNGKLQNKTDSYITQSLWFFLKNYLRIKVNRTSFISLDEPINGEEILLKEIIPDNTPSFTESLETEMFIKTVMNNGLSKREKEVFKLCLEGYNLRDAGKRLGISHVMVFKIQKSIQKKIKNKIGK